jgi:hypothetical protein
MLRAAPPAGSRITVSAQAARCLWVVAVLDMVGLAWMLVLGEWLDHASPVTAVMTLGGRHLLVLTLSGIGFLLLMASAWPTHGFRQASKVQLGLIIVGCALSIVALAGALSAILLVLTGALVLGLVIRPLFR